MGSGGGEEKRRRGEEWKWVQEERRRSEVRRGRLDGYIKPSRITNIIFNQKSEVSQHIHTAQAHRGGSLSSGHALQATISPWLMAHRTISNWRLWKIMSKRSVILNTSKKKLISFVNMLSTYSEDGQDN